jgi:hypothetical protein
MYVLEDHLMVGSKLLHDTLLFLNSVYKSISLKRERLYVCVRESACLCVHVCMCVCAHVHLHDLVFNSSPCMYSVDAF